MFLLFLTWPRGQRDRVSAGHMRGFGSCRHTGAAGQKCSPACLRFPDGVAGRFPDGPSYVKYRNVSKTRRDFRGMTYNTLL